MTAFTLRLIAPGYSGVTLDVTETLPRYRVLQTQAAAAALPLPPEWRARIPTTVSSEPRADSAPADAADAEPPTQIWTPEGGGLSAVPVGFLDIGRDLAEPISTRETLFEATAERVGLRFHDFGVYVVQLDVAIAADPAAPLGALRAAIERSCAAEFERYLSDTAKGVAKAFASLAASLPAPLFEPKEDCAGTLGAHRVFMVGADETEDLDARFAALRDLVNFPKPQSFTDSAGSKQARCAVGDGNSLLLTRRGRPLRSVDPSRAIAYYQFYYAALLRLDRRLLSEMPKSLHAASPDRREIDRRATALRRLRRHAALFRELGEESVNGMSPTDYNYWRVMGAQWRTDEIERNLTRKLAFLDSRIGEAGMELEERASIRAGNILLLLSSMAILSVSLDLVDALRRDAAFEPIELAALGGGVALAVMLVALGFRR